MNKSFDSAVTLGNQTSADELTHLISIVEAIDRGSETIANSLYRKGCCRLPSHSPGRVEIAGDFL